MVIYVLQQTFRQNLHFFHKCRCYLLLFTFITFNHLIHIWPVELSGARNKRKLQNEKFLSTVGFEHSRPSLPVYHLIHVASNRLLWTRNLKSIIRFYEVRSINKLLLSEHVSAQHDVHCLLFQWYNICIDLQIDQCRYFMTVLRYLCYINAYRVGPLTYMYVHV